MDFIQLFGKHPKIKNCVSLAGDTVAKYIKVEILYNRVKSKMAVHLSLEIIIEEKATGYLITSEIHWSMSTTNFVVDFNFRRFSSRKFETCSCKSFLEGPHQSTAVQAGWALDLKIIL